MTDANVMLGKIQPQFFPPVFGPGGDAPLEAGVVRAKFAELAGRIRAATGDARSPEEVAEGFVNIAVGNMANAIKHISVQRGHDVTGYTLCCFGGAAGQHACLVADALAMTRVFIHPFAGVLSAYGMGLADQTAMRQMAVEARLDEGGCASLVGELDRLAAEARSELLGQGVEPERIRVVQRVHLKYEGTDTALVVPLGTLAEMVARFEEAYRQQYSFLMPGKALIVEAVSAEAIGAAETLATAGSAPGRGEPAAAETVRMFSGGCWHATPVYRREELGGGSQVNGPAIIAEANATTVVEPGWRGRSHPREPPRAGARRAAGSAGRHRHRGRPGDAGDLQQPLHVDRRADGAAAAEHRLLGEHQGAAGFLLRPVSMPPAT